MPVSIKVPQIGYNGYFVNVNWYISSKTHRPEWQYAWERDVEDFTRIQRYQHADIDGLFKALGVDAKGFWKNYEEKLEAAQEQVSATATGDFRKIIAERAYIDELTSVSEDGTVKFAQRENYWYNDGKTPTGEFIDAWDVHVHLAKSGVFHFDLIYNYEDMSTAGGGEGRNYPMHESFEGEDYRQALADILNIPNKFTSNGEFVRRRGYWQQTFDSMCREKYYPMLVDLLKNAEVIS